MTLNPFPAVGRGISGFFGWLHAAFCALLTEQGLKAWALVMAWGCSVAMTGLATFGMWTVRTVPWMIFWLSTQAMFIILVVITGIMVILGVRRNIVGKHGDTEIGISDAGDGSAQ